MDRVSKVNGRQVTILAPEEAERDAARRELLRITRENLATARVLVRAPSFAAGDIG